MQKLVVGVLGGGQLGRMMVEAASRLNIQVAVLDSENAPAKQINLVAADKHVGGSFANATDVAKLAANCDVITYEIEHVDTKILEQLESEQPFVSGTKWNRIQPSWKTVQTIKDKFAQKQHLAKYDIPSARSIDVGSSQLQDIGEQLGYPFMLKAKTEAYDGRGNYPVRVAEDASSALEALKGRPLYAEKWADFRMELAVMVVKTRQEVATDDDAWESATLAYPTVETIHEDSICKLVYVPARGVAKPILQQAQRLARRAVSTFEGTGVFGVEMFLLGDDSLVVNEIAPRPHNSGHYTIEACHMSQYQAQIRAILPNLASKIKPGSTDLRVPAAVMLNILGGPQPDSHLLVAEAAMEVPGAEVHLYGKGAGRPKRKMGHITITGSSMSEVESKIHPLIALVDAVRASDSTHTASDIQSTTKKLLEANPTPSARPRIAVVMGSDTDLATLRPGLQLLEQVGVPYSVNITSAHRTPQYMLDFGKAAASRGYKVIIAAAGGAAHLPGMIASVTSVPVIGVPVKASSLDGLDSLLAIVQMPRGIPVATMSIGNSTNAAILAARIVGTSEPLVQAWVEKHLQTMEDENLAKDVRLVHEGWQSYKKLDS